MKHDTAITEIARQNDRFRREGLGAGRIFITAGIRALPVADRHAIFQKVKDFDAFTEDNDPWGEHDFGSFAHDGHKIFWKIDYYAPGFEYGSENPADPARTVRVLTIMLAEEW